MLENNLAAATVTAEMFTICMHRVFDYKDRLRTCIRCMLCTKTCCYTYSIERERERERERELVDRGPGVSTTVGGNLSGQSETLSVLTKSL